MRRLPPLPPRGVTNCGRQIERRRLAAAPVEKTLMSDTPLPPRSPLWTLAVHQAGHCVMAHALGVQVLRVIRRDDLACHVIWDRADSGDRASAEIHGMIALAGVAAQWLYRSGTVRAEDVCRDDRMAENILRRIEPDALVEEPWREYLRQRALNEIARPRRQLLIACLAGFLVSRERTEDARFTRFSSGSRSASQPCCPIPTPHSSNGSESPATARWPFQSSACPSTPASPGHFAPRGSRRWAASSNTARAIFERSWAPRMWIGSLPPSLDAVSSSRSIPAAMSPRSTSRLAGSSTARRWRRKRETRREREHSLEIADGPIELRLLLRGMKRVALVCLVDAFPAREAAVGGRGVVLLEASEVVPELNDDACERPVVRSENFPAHASRAGCPSSPRSSA